MVQLKRLYKGFTKALVGRDTATNKRLWPTEVLAVLRSPFYSHTWWDKRRGENYWSLVKAGTVEEGLPTRNCGHASAVHKHWKGSKSPSRLVKIQIAGSPGRLEVENCTSGKLLGDPDVSGVVPTLWEPLPLKKRITVGRRGRRYK